MTQFRDISPLLPSLAWNKWRLRYGYLDLAVS